MTAACQPHPSVSQKMETRNAGIAMIKNARFIFAAFLAAPCAGYGLYVAAVRSDSHTVMLETAAPFGVARISFAVCS
jgi:hypothetical protein